MNQSKTGKHGQFLFPFNQNHLLPNKGPISSYKDMHTEDSAIRLISKALILLGVPHRVDKTAQCGT
jgi:hypothetical protein